MGFVQQKSTSSVLPNTCDLLLENVDQSVEKYNVELVDKALEEEPQAKEPEEDKSRLGEAVYFAEANAVSNTVRFIDSLIDTLVISAISYLVVTLDFIPLRESSVFLIIFLVYYLALETFFSKTVGKMVLGLKVVDIDGNKPGFAAFLIRTIIRLVPLDCMSFVIIKGWFRHEYQGHWHDKWSDTYVVKQK